MKAIITFICLALVVFAADTSDKHASCFMSFAGINYVLPPRWMDINVSNFTKWHINPCQTHDSLGEGGATFDNQNEDLAGAYFTEEDAQSHQVTKYSRGLASTAVWQPIWDDTSVVQGMDIALTNPNGNEANPQCAAGNEYTTRLSYICDGTVHEPQATLTSESDCEASFRILWKHACPVEDKTIYKRSHSFVLFMLISSVLFSFCCCMLALRKRKQAKILNNNFSNVAFQPIPKKSAISTVRVPTQNPHVPLYNPQQNHIHVPQSYFFTQPVIPMNNSHCVQLEKSTQETQDAQLARSLQNQYDNENRF